MSQRYDEPDLVARTANTVIRWLAEAGLSIAGTRAMRVRGRRTGRQHAVVVNLMTVDGVDYLVSPRGNTQWARNARAAGVVEVGPALASPLSDGHRGVRRGQAAVARALPRPVVLGGQRTRRRSDAAVRATRAAGRCAVDPGVRARFIAPAPAR